MLTHIFGDDYKSLNYEELATARNTAFQGSPVRAISLYVLVDIIRDTSMLVQLLTSKRISKANKKRIEPITVQLYLELDTLFTEFAARLEKDTALTQLFKPLFVQPKARVEVKPTNQVIGMQTLEIKSKAPVR